MKYREREWRGNSSPNPHRSNISISILDKRYRRLVQRLPQRIRWLALILAPAGTSSIVFASGLLKLAGSLLITAGIGQLASESSASLRTTSLLILAFIAESIGFWIKERHELLLTTIVRQLTYRRFRRVLRHSSVSLEARNKILTFPGQISQFAYVVDASVATIQIFAFLVASLHYYGISGAVAAVLIAGMVTVSVKLIHRIGAVWERYISLEGERRRWLQRIAEALPRARNIPSWNSALSNLLNIRKTEENLLHQRVPLQVLNGFLERGALTTMVATVAVLGALLWPGTEFGIGIILAARYLYAAVQGNLVNYRIIKLAVPMMRELDVFESHLARTRESVPHVAPPARGQEILDDASDRAEALRTLAVPSAAAFIPRNPEMTQLVLSMWRASSTADHIARFTSIASRLGLHDDVVRRIWHDIATLSSGEAHRAAIAVALADEPEWLILDDTFASLDPATRELAARVIIDNVPACTLLARSEEYIPRAFSQGTAVSEDGPAPDVDLVPAGNDHKNSTDGDNDAGLPDPDPRQRTFGQSVRLLFGARVLWVALGALLMSSADVALALAISQSDSLSPRTVGLAAACAIAMLLGSGLFFIPLYRLPITRLSALHTRIVQQMAHFATPGTSGAVAGRVGEDFSNLQMSVPSALGTVFLVVAQTLLLVGTASAGAPIFAVVVLGIAPLAWLAMRRGSHRILSASTATARHRDEFVGAASVQAGIRKSPVSQGLRAAAEAAYECSELAYLASSVRLAHAYTFRSMLIQLLVLSLNISAVILTVMAGPSHPLVATTAVVYFAVTLSSGIQSTVQTLHEAGVVGLTAARVQLLETHRREQPTPPVRTAEVKRVENALDSDCHLVALIGSTGAGKSLILDELHSRRPEGDATIIPEVDPFAADPSDSSGLSLLHSALTDDTTRLLLLDETFKGLTPSAERIEIDRMTRVLESTGKQAVVTLHSRSNLDLFRAIVNLDD